MTMQTDWKNHFKDTKDYPPSPLLVKALPHVVRKTGKAIDIGGGALKDSRYLLEQGFDVTVIDQEPSVAEMVAEIGSDKLHVTVAAFVDFAFPEDAHDLASAMFSLPFNPPETFDAVFGRIKRSLVKGGIFCGQLFGVRDEWITNSTMTFRTKEEVEALLADLETISLEERERDAKLSDGTPKHWHQFDIIVRKK
jgi:SAM-dependent methyltransferase